MEIRISKYWKYQLNKETAELSDLKPGRTWKYKIDDNSYELRCNECCNGDRCGDPTHRRRESCPSCLGSGRNADCYNTDGSLKIVLKSTIVK